MGSSHLFQSRKQESSSSFTRPAHAPTPASSFAAQNHSGRPPHIGHSLVKIPVANPTPDTIEMRESGTSLPHALRSSIENLSGIPLNDVQIHYNSPKPALARALAYTQGSEIYLGPRQERHLAHEVWHVVQQKQGRVLPTHQARGMRMNDDRALEKEANLIESAAPGVEKLSYSITPSTVAVSSAPVVQYFGAGTQEEVAAGELFEKLLQTFSEDQGLIAFYQERFMIYKDKLKKLSAQKGDVRPKRPLLSSGGSKLPVPVKLSKEQTISSSKLPVPVKLSKEQAKGALPSLSSSKLPASTKLSSLKPKGILAPPGVSKLPVPAKSSSLKEEEEEVLTQSGSLEQKEKEEEREPTLDEQIGTVRDLLIQLQEELEQSKTQILDLYPTIKLSSLDPYYVPLVDDVLGRNIQVVQEPQRMGKEVEVPSLVITPNSIPPKNGQLLAYTKAMELGLPVIKMETEGADRGSLTVEIIYGPLLLSEYASKNFEKAVKLLDQHFQAPRQATFAERINQYNNAVRNVDKRYTLVITLIGNQAKTSAKTITKNIQTNVSIPYSALGDVKETEILDKLFYREDKQIIIFYAQAREVSKELVATFYKGNEGNITSLLAHVFYQNDVYAYYRIKQGQEKKEDKFRFHVMIKASPEDAIFSILSTEEVTSLLTWLNKGGDKIIEQKALEMYTWFEVQKGILRSNIKSTVESLKQACEVRLQEGEQQLVRTRGKVDGRDNPISVTKGGSEITHHLPRPSNRIPISRDPGGRGYIVIEQRTAKNPLNKSELAKL